jgi:hypothetical protein
VEDVLNERVGWVTIFRFDAIAKHKALMKNELNGDYLAFPRSQMEFGNEEQASEIADPVWSLEEVISLLD